MVMNVHADPGPPCPLVERLPVLGVPTAFETNSARVMERVRATYGTWAELRAQPELLSSAGATVRIVETTGDARGLREGGDVGDVAEVRAAHRVLGPGRLRIEVSGGTGETDTARRISVARVSRALVAREDAFVEGLLEPLTLFLLCALDRRPLHASAVVRDGTAVLLAGPSGSGKSTLAHAAGRAGFRVLADEPVFVQLEPRLRVWGRRSRVHLEVEARAHFPELGGVAVTPLSTGKSKIVVPGRAGEPRHAERVGICLLRRADGAAPELRRLTPAAVVAELTHRLDPGYDLWAGSIGERIARVAECGAWSLHWSGGPDAALPLLERAATEIERGG
jgi:hypothetical protein